MPAPAALRPGAMPWYRSQKFSDMSRWLAVQDAM